MSFKNYSIMVKSISLCLLLGACWASSVRAQNSSDTDNNSMGTDPFGGDPFGGIIDTNLKIPPIPGYSSPQPSELKNSDSSSQDTRTTNESIKKAELPFSSAASRETSLTPDEPSSFQNAIIEGVQITTEKGETPDEKIVTGYFIFRDKPSSYFYDIRVREKKLVFEFNDTKTGSSPVPTVSEPPIKGFTIESGKVDVNKAVKGLMPEWHDLIKIVFDLEEVPKVNVNDEYSIISFSFKWSSDPKKIKNYVVKDNSRKVLIISTAGIGSAALGALGYLFLKPEPEPEVLSPLPIDDLPNHKTGVQ